MSASERLGGPELKVFLAGRIAFETDGTLIGEERFRDGKVEALAVHEPRPQLAARQRDAYGREH
jgi:hypothetical protein